MPGDNSEESILERMAASLAGLVALTVAQMTNPGRTKPWTQQELIIALAKGGLRSKEIVGTLGVPRTIVDPTLSRYRKAKEQKTTRSLGAISNQEG